MIPNGPSYLMVHCLGLCEAGREVVAGNRVDEMMMMMMMMMMMRGIHDGSTNLRDGGNNRSSP